MKAKFGVFSLSQVPDLDRTVETLDGDFQQFLLAEELGFDSVWVAEHLFSNYGVITSTQILLSAIARHTKRVRIGSAISCIPLNHPFRTASDFAAVDCFSHGRLNFGVGRAYQPHEFAGLSLPMDRSREMFSEGMAMILKAWMEPEVTFAGEFWNVTEPVQVLPKPVQRPHPPVYLASTSPATFVEAGRLGWNVLMSSAFSYRTFRGDWVDKVAEQVGQYESALAETWGSAKATERVLTVPFYVAETEQAALDEFGPRAEWFYNKINTNDKVAGLGKGVVKGYELTITEGRKTRELDLLHFSNLHEHSAVIVGSPESCVRKLNALKERLGITEFILWFNLGGVPNELAQKSMRIAARDVLPHV